MIILIIIRTISLSIAIIFTFINIARTVVKNNIPPANMIYNGISLALFMATYWIEQLIRQ